MRSKSTEADEIRARNFANKDAKELQLSWVEDGGKEQINNRPEGSIDQWDREKMLTPYLDKLLKNRINQWAIILDAWRAGGNTLLQTIFVIKPYSWENIFYLTANPPKDDSFSHENTYLGTQVKERLIPIPSYSRFDDQCKYVAWLAAGLKKTPTTYCDDSKTKEKIMGDLMDGDDSLLAIMEQLMSKMLIEETLHGSDSQKYKALWNECVSLRDKYDEEYQQKANQIKNGQVAPLKYTIDLNLVSKEDRTALRQYLKKLGQIAGQVAVKLYV